MDEIFKAERLKIYINPEKKTAEEVKAEEGCSHAINLALFETKTYKPVGNLKADGVVINQQWGADKGFFWSGTEPLQYDWTDMKSADNFFSCVRMIEDGKPIVPLEYNKEMGGERQRTAFGVTEDGRIWMYANKVNQMTPEELQAFAATKGLKHALMMDGGLSTQGAGPNGTVKGGRPAYSLLCAWAEEDNSENKEGESMAVKIGHASSDENRKAHGGAAGDQTGGEVCTRNWYSSPWDVVLRCTDEAKAEKMARACEQACANNNIGYDQYQRNTLLTQAKAKNWNLSKISVKCECDCSSLMTVCAQCAGIEVPYISGNAPYTGNMRTQFMSTGKFKVLVASKYLTSDAYLKRGDILVRTSGHTAMVLSDGAKANIVEPGTSEISGKIDTVKEVQAWLNNTYSAGLTLDGLYGSLMKKALVKALQKELGFTGKDVDGIYGPKTNKAVKTLRKGSTGMLVKILQATLVCNGQKAAYVDGDFGSGTESAVIEIQRIYRLTVDGIAGKATFTALMA